MRIAAIDDERPALFLLLDAIKDACPDAEVQGYDDPEALLNDAAQKPVDIAFLDVQIYDVLGTDVAIKLKKMYPRINVIFVTAYDNYVSDAMRMHASGYIRKPVTAEDIRREMGDLRYEPEQAPNYVATAKCFGNFDLFTPGGAPVNFSRAKSKELFAYLICKQGSSCTVGELGGILFEDEPYDQKKKMYMQKIIFDMVKDLEHAGMGALIRKSYNSISVNPQQLKCDYYDYLNEVPGADKLYRGEFMNQYSWAEEYNSFWQ